jgi:O-methyltransferase
MMNALRRSRSDLPRHKLTDFEYKVNRWFVLAHDLVTLPITVVALFYSARIHPGYGVTWRKKFRLAWRMYWNCVAIETATSFKAHLAMAAKLLEVKPETEGVVVECGCFQGGSAANLSLACELAGRELILYDSFEGLPPAEKGDRYANEFTEGAFRGSIETVRDNITRRGAIDVCTFRKGWFKDTLPHHTEHVVMLFMDVDFQASLHDCLIHLWPKLRNFAYVYIDEYVLVDYCAVFFSERYWRTYFDTTPPGLFGTGTGIPIGQYFVGPFLATPPLQSPGSIAYTFKGASGYWDYFPEDYAEPDPTPAAIDEPAS